VNEVIAEMIEESDPTADEEKAPKVVTKKKPAAKAKVIFKKPASSAQASMVPSTDVPVETVPGNEKDAKPAKVKQSSSQKIQDRMAAERRAKVATAKKEIERKDKVRFEEDEKQAEVSRKKVKAESAERKSKEDKIEKVKTQTKAQARKERKEASAARMAERGKSRCAGSNLDVEKEGLALTSGGKVRENPWSKKGKRVRCPKCKRSVGIHTVGRKSTQAKPTSYNLNTHYVKVGADGKPKKVSVKVAKKVKATKTARVAKKKVAKKTTKK
jgi:hypothetical protein